MGEGSIGIICPASLVPAVSGVLEDAGVASGAADRHGLEQQVTVVPVGLVKRTELDARRGRACGHRPRGAPGTAGGSTWPLTRPPSA